VGGERREEMEYLGHWVPGTKQQLVVWLGKVYKEPETNFEKKSKKQLYAIYYSAIRRIGNED
jgi:hypothetical protein